MRWVIGDGWTGYSRTETLSSLPTYQVAPFDTSVPLLA